MACGDSGNARPRRDYDQRIAGKDRNNQEDNPRTAESGEATIGAGLAKIGHHEEEMLSMSRCVLLRRRRVTLEVLKQVTRFHGPGAGCQKFETIPNFQSVLYFAAISLCTYLDIVSDCRGIKQLWDRQWT